MRRRSKRGTMSCSPICKTLSLETGHGRDRCSCILRAEGVNFTHRRDGFSGDSRLGGSTIEKPPSQTFRAGFTLQWCADP